MFDGIPLFAGLTSTQTEKLSLFCQERYLRKDELLFQEGDEASVIYVLRSGILQVYCSRSMGDETLAILSTPGDIIGEMAIFGEAIPRSRSASVRAIDPTHIITIMDYAMQSLATDEPAIIESIRTVIRARHTENILKK